MTVPELRARARAVLAGTLALDADEVRRAHNLACLFRDEEAIALWARVVWRSLAGDGRYDWLRKPAGGGSTRTDWSVAPAAHPPPKPPEDPQPGPEQRFCVVCKVWTDHDGRSHRRAGGNKWRPTNKVV